MLNRLWLGLLYTVQLIKELLTTILHSDFITTQVRIGSVIALLSLATQERAVVYLSHVFLIMFLTQGLVYLLTTMRTYGSQVEVEAWVDVGVVLEAMVFLLLTAVNLLVAYHLCT